MLFTGVLFTGFTVQLIKTLMSDSPAHTAGTDLMLSDLMLIKTENF
jgi:hypothetical protein